MKNMKKIMLPVVILIIMVGAIIVATAGFKFDLMYQSHKRIEIYIDKDYKVEEVADMVKEETSSDNIIKQDIETFNKDIAFVVKTISSEQEENLEKAINEKYELKDKDSVVVVKEPHFRLRDIMKPYVLPLILSSVIICAYFAIKYRKTGLVNSLCIPAGALIVAQALYFSLIAILRIPVSKLTMPIAVLVYIITALVVSVELQNAKDEKKAKSRK